MARTTFLPLPERGLRSSDRPNRQRDGSTRRARNIRNRDWVGGGVSALAQRSGCSKFLTTVVKADSKIQAVLSTERFEATYTPGSLTQLAQDTFTRANTTPPALGTFVDTQAWTVAGTVGTELDDRVVTTNHTVEADASDYDVWGDNASQLITTVAASTGGPQVSSNTVIDAMNLTAAEMKDGVTSKKWSWAYCQLSDIDAIASPSSLVDFGEFFEITIDFATTADFTTGGGNTISTLGLFMFGDSSLVTTTGRDDAIYIGATIYGTAATTARMTLCCGTNTSPTTPTNTNWHAFSNSVGSHGVGLVASDRVSANQITLANSTTYTLKLRRLRNRLEVWLQASGGSEQFVDAIPDVTIAANEAASRTDTTRTHYGFICHNINTGTDCSITLLDDFTINSFESLPDTYSNSIAAVAGGNVYVSQYTGAASTIAVATDGTGAASATNDVTLVAGLGPSEDPNDPDQRVYVLDGEKYQYISMSSGAMFDWVPDAGVLPGSSRAAQFGTTWADSMVLWGIDDQYSVSAALNYDDWDITDADPLRAFSDRIVGNVKCCIAFDVGSLVVASAGRLYARLGRPALGFGLNEITNEVGIVGAEAATLDEFGNLWFVSMRGLHLVPRGTDLRGKFIPPQVSDRQVDAFFDAIDHTTEKVIVQWNAAEQGLWVMIVEAAQPSVASRAMFASGPATRPSALFFSEDSFPGDISPTATTTIAEVDVLGSPRTIFGSWDGYLRILDPAATDDDSQRIASDCDVQVPSKLFAGSMILAGMGKVQITTGPTHDSCVVGLLGADNFSAIESMETQVEQDIISTGLNPAMNASVGGGAASVRITGSSTIGEHWVVYDILADIDTGHRRSGDFL